MKEVYIHTKIEKALNSYITAMAKRAGRTKCSIINHTLKEGLMACATKKATKKTTKKTTKK